MSYLLARIAVVSMQKLTPEVQTACLAILVVLWPLPANSQNAWAYFIGLGYFERKMMIYVLGYVAVFLFGSRMKSWWCDHIGGSRVVFPFAVTYAVQLCSVYPQELSDTIEQHKGPAYMVAVAILFNITLASSFIGVLALRPSRLLYSLGAPSLFAYVLHCYVQLQGRWYDPAQLVLLLGDQRVSPMALSTGLAQLLLLLSYPFTMILIAAVLALVMQVMMQQFMKLFKAE